jgi:PPOX class probable F420-dependent enzyme
MTVTLSESAKGWLDAAEFATIATLLPDGQPQLSVVWAARDGDDILISTLEGRQKHRNLTRDPRATVLIYPKDSPYSYLEVRGTVTMTRDGGPELIDALAHKYTGKPYGNDGPDDVRVVLRLTASKVVNRG